MLAPMITLPILAELRFELLRIWSMLSVPERIEVDTPHHSMLLDDSGFAGRTFYAAVLEQGFQANQAAQYFDEDSQRYYLGSYLLSAINHFEYEMFEPCCEPEGSEMYVLRRSGTASTDVKLGMVHTCHLVMFHMLPQVWRQDLPPDIRKYIAKFTAMLSKVGYIDYEDVVPEVAAIAACDPEG
jgi:hypothetical protein